MKLCNQPREDLKIVIFITRLVVISGANMESNRSTNAYHEVEQEAEV